MGPPYALQRVIGSRIDLEISRCLNRGLKRCCTTSFEVTGDAKALHRTRHVLLPNTSQIGHANTDGLVTVDAKGIRLSHWWFLVPLWEDNLPKLWLLGHEFVRQKEWIW